MKKDFSVLMSVYYRERPEYLKKSIESIINQTVAPKEIVIVKDGKLTKELDEIIDNYDVKKIELKENVGLGKALKIGVENCKYNIIARMDSDDISVPNRFETQLKEFDKDPQLVLVGGQVHEFDENNLGRKRIVPTDKDEIIKFSKKRNPFNHMTVMFKKEPVLEVGNYHHMQYFEDYYLWVLLLKNNYKLINVNDVLVYVRGGSSLTKKRGGIKYINSTYNFEKSIYKLKYIKFNEFALNLMIRIPICLVPNKIRRSVYTRFLRN